MALRNIFKKIKKEEENKKEEKLEEKAVKPEKSKIKEKISGTTYRILKMPQVTEKATDLVKKNQYIFKVWPEANKIEIKNAIKDIYSVDVLSVKIIKVPAKKRRLGKISGLRKGYKKAIVKIKEGQKIEVLPR